MVGLEGKVTDLKSIGNKGNITNETESSINLY